MAWSGSMRLQIRVLSLRFGNHTATYYKKFLLGRKKQTVPVIWGLGLQGVVTSPAKRKSGAFDSHRLH